MTHPELVAEVAKLREEVRALREAVTTLEAELLRRTTLSPEVSAELRKAFSK